MVFRGRPLSPRVSLSVERLGDGTFFVQRSQRNRCLGDPPQRRRLSLRYGVITVSGVETPLAQSPPKHGRIRSGLAVLAWLDQDHGHRDQALNDRQPSLCRKIGPTVIDVLAGVPIPGTRGALTRHRVGQPGVYVEGFPAVSCLFELGEVPGRERSRCMLHRSQPTTGSGGPPTRKPADHCGS